MSGMTKVYKQNRWGYYKCNAYHLPKRYGFKCDNAQYKVEEVDAAVWGWVESILLSEDKLAEAFGRYQENQEEILRPQLAMLETNQAKLETLQLQKKRLITAYQRDVLSLDEFAEQKTHLDKELAELTAAVGLLEAEIKPQLLTKEDIDTVQVFASKIRKGIDLSVDDTESRREILRLLNTEVVLSVKDDEKWAEIACILVAHSFPMAFNGTNCSGSASTQNESSRLDRPCIGLWRTATQTC